MRTLSLPHSPLILAALITAVSFQPLLAQSISVVDPSTGETVELSEVDFEALSEEERADIRDQLKEQGVQPRGGDRNALDISEVEVVDPSTGETVALGGYRPLKLESRRSAEHRRSTGRTRGPSRVAAGVTMQAEIRIPAPRRLTLAKGAAVAKVVAVTAVGTVLAGNIKPPRTG